MKSSRLTTIIFAISVTLGVFLIVGPLILGRINQLRSESAIQSYRDTTADSSKYDEVFKKAEIFNDAIAGRTIDEGIKDQYSEILDFEYGMIGYIEIPRIGVRDPIYHGVGEDVLQRGIGHLPTTSFPIGGVGNHAALSGHRGLPSSKLFTDLDQVRKDDIILIRVAMRTLAYAVFDIETVEPDYMDGLAIDPNEDLLTLITCTPYAVNSHRLLVHARRVDYSEEMDGIRTEHTISESDRILLVALAIVATILAVDIVIIVRRNRRS